MRLLYTFLLMIGCVAGGLVATAQQSFTTGQRASMVIGQQDFFTNSANSDINTLGQVSSIAISSKGIMVAISPIGHLWVWNRTPLSSATPADYMLNYNTGLGGVAFSHDGTKLLLCQSDNNRILVYNGVPTSTSAPTQAIIGQANEFAVSSGCSNRTFSNPAGITCLPDGRVIVADNFNGRYLIFNKIPTQNFDSASVVIGRPDFTTTAGGVTSSLIGTFTRRNSSAVASAVSPDGKLAIIDNINQRVLLYNTIPTVNGAPADVVIGQAIFTTGTTATSATKIRNPAQVVFTADRKLLISEYGNNRVAVFNSIPTVNGASIDGFLGQVSASTSTVRGDTIGIARPQGLALDNNGRLFVVSRSQNRIMVFGNLPSVQADVVVSSKNNTSSIGCNGSNTNETFVVKNNGNTAINVTVAVSLPYPILVSSTLSTGTYASSSGLWTIPQLNAGDSATITLTGFVPGFLQNVPLSIGASIIYSSGLDVNGYNNAIQYTKIFDGQAGISAPIISSTPLSNCSPNSTISVANENPAGMYYWNNGAIGSSISISKSGTYSAQLVLNGCTSAISNIITINSGLDSIYFNSSNIAINGFTKVGTYGGREYYLSKKPIAATQLFNQALYPVIFRDGAELDFVRNLPAINNTTPILTGYTSIANSSTFTSPAYEVTGGIQPWLPNNPSSDTAARVAVAMFRSDAGYFGLSAYRKNYSEAYFLGYLPVVRTETSLCNASAISLPFIGQPNSTYRLSNRIGFYNTDSATTNSIGFGILNSTVIAGADTLFITKTTSTCTRIVSSSLYLTNFTKPSIEPIGRTTTCVGGNVSFRISNPVAGYEYVWNNGIIANAITVNVLGAYYAYPIRNGCYGPNSDTLVAALAPLTEAVSISVNGDTILQPDEFTIITANTTLPNVLWNNGSTARSITIRASGVYSVQGVDINGCKTDPTYITFTQAALTSGNTYSFAQRNNTYATITSSFTTISSNSDIDEQVFTGISLPFSFNYYGVTYNDISVNTNGILYFGNNNTAINSSPFTNATVSQNPFIAALATDLRAYTTGSIVSSTQGIAPNRLFIIQWRNFKQQGLTGTNINFQIALLESNNSVEIRYGALSIGNLLAVPQVGINEYRAGVQYPYIRNYTGTATDTLTWQESSLATSNNSTMPFSSTAFPSNGLTYRYIPEGVSYRELNSFRVYPNAISGQDTLRIQGSGFTNLPSLVVGNLPISQIIYRNDSRITAILPNKNIFGIIEISNTTSQASSTQNICITRAAQIVQTDGGTLCDANTYATLSIANSDTTLSYQWLRNGSLYSIGGSSITTNVDGTYTVRITLGSGCSSLSNAIIITTNKLPEPVIVQAGSTFTDFANLGICIGLTLRFAFQGQVGATYRLVTDRNIQLGTNLLASGNSSVDTFRVQVPIDANYISIQGINDGCATFFNTGISVTGANLPIITLPDGLEACAGYGIRLRVSNVDPSATYIWNNGQRGTEIIAYSSGTFSVQAANSICVTGFSPNTSVIIHPTPHDPVFIPSGVAHYYNMNGAGHNTIAPSMPATLVNVEPFSDRFGVPSGAFRFKGLNSYISLPTGNYFSNNYSISFWTQLFSSRPNASFLDFATSTNQDRINFYQSGSQFAIQSTVGGSSQSATISPDTIPLNQWVHISITQDNNSQVVYKNGIEWYRNNTPNLNSGITTTNNFLGKSNDATSVFMDGAVDDLMIFGRALASSDISYMYYQQNPKRSVEEVSSCGGSPVSLSLYADSGIQYRMVDIADNPLSAYTNAQNGILNITSSNISRSTDSIKLEGLSSDGCRRIFNYRLGYNLKPVSRTTLNVVTCQSNYIFQGDTITTSGIYERSYTSTQGCDSLITLNISFQPFITNYVIKRICNGSSTYIGDSLLTTSGIYTKTLRSAFGCDSILTLELIILDPIETATTVTICEGSVYVVDNRPYTEAGIYPIVLQSALGCDSTVNLRLKVAQLDSIQIDTGVCYGQFLTINNLPYYPGEYRIVLQNKFMCDSIINIRIRETPLPINTTYVTNCSNNTYFWRGRILSATGIYSDTIVQSKQGACDSIVSINFTSLSGFNDINTVSTCSNTPYNFRGRMLSISGRYTDSLISANGCDSLYILNLDLRPLFHVDINRSICAGGTFVYNGQPYAQAGTYNFNYTNIFGCDSSYTLNLSIEPVLFSPISVSICSNSSYTFKGIVLTQAGTYYDTLRAVAGCDSVVTLTLMVNSPVQQTITNSICTGQIFLFNSRSLTSAGVYYDTLTTLAGCDSIITLNLQLRQTILNTINAAICSGASYQFNNRSLTIAGTYSDTLRSTGGCDSIVVLNLQLRQALIDTISATICSGFSYQFNNRSLTIAGTYSDTLRSTGGCDSIVVLNLRVLPAPIAQLTIRICANNTYQFGSRLLTTAGIYSDTTRTNARCDSVTILNLIVDPAVNNLLSATICQNSSYVLGNRILTTQGRYIDTLTSASGCDSVVQVTLFVLPVTEDTFIAYTCRGNTYSWPNGPTLIAPAQAIWYDSTAQGCVNRHTYFLNVRPELLPPTITLAQNILSTTSLATAYRWKKDGILFIQTTEPSLIITESGAYTLALLDTTGCYSDESNVIVVNSTASKSLASIEVHPNPFIEQMIVRMANAAKVKSITLTDYLGKTVMHDTKAINGQEYLLQAPNLPCGTYLLRIVTDQGNQMLKVVKAE